jgi:hypothetical protein
VNLLFSGTNGYFAAYSRFYVCNSTSTAFCPVSIDTNAGVLSAAFLHETLFTPASSSAACAAGDFADDANYHYVCVGASTWKRIALSAF